VSDDPLADIGKKSRVTDKTLQILALADSIMAAKQRGGTWKDIADRLSDRGLPISAQYLRALMERHARSPVVPKASSGKGKALGSPRPPPPPEPEDDSLPATSNQDSDSDSDPSDHAGIRRRNARP
jgi:hypothetical protein